MHTHAYSEKYTYTHTYLSFTLSLSLYIYTHTNTHTNSNSLARAHTKLYVVHTHRDMEVHSYLRVRMVIEVSSDIIKDVSHIFAASLVDFKKTHRGVMGGVIMRGPLYVSVCVCDLLNESAVCVMGRECVLRVTLCV